MFTLQPEQYLASLGLPCALQREGTLPKAWESPWSFLPALDFSLMASRSDEPNHTRQHLRLRNLMCPRDDDRDVHLENRFRSHELH